MDTIGMTLEQFFLADYEKLKEENEQLKRKIADFSNESEYGVKDLNNPVELIKISTPTFYYYQESKLLKSMSDEEIEGIISKGFEDFVKWAKSFSIGAYDTYSVIKEETKRYRYTIEVFDMDGKTKYAFDPRRSDVLIELGLHEEEMADNLGYFMDTDMRDELLSAAASEAKENLRRYIKEREKLNKEQ